MPVYASTARAVGLVTLLATFVPAAPSGAQTEASLPDLFAGSAVPNTIKLKDLTPEWRRVSIGGEMMLGMGGMMQSMMQSLGSMFGGGSDAFYSRGATLRIGGEQFLVGYRLPTQGVDFATLMAAGASGGAGQRPKLPERKPVTPETELTLTLINLRAIASFSDIRPFSLEEIMKPPPMGLLDVLGNAKETAETRSAEANLKQLALGMLMYVQDYDEVLPPMQDTQKLKKLLLPYVKNEEIFKSPSTGQPFRANPRLSKRSLATLDPRGMVMFFSGVPEPDGSRLIARVDGTVRRVGPAEWQKLAAAQRLPPE